MAVIFLRCPTTELTVELKITQLMQKGSKNCIFSGIKFDRNDISEKEREKHTEGLANVR
jgi:hypothetical protein